jgi:micrococcal nuclease
MGKFYILLTVKRKIFYFIFLIFGLTSSLNNWSLNSQIENKGKDIFKVIKVIDSDTIKLNNGKNLRYIGVDTPEIRYKTKSDCYAKEAKEFNKNLVLNQNVKLEKDVSETDKYKRLLRYVYIVKESTTSALFVNEELVKKGYAVVSTYPPDVKYVNKFLQAQEYARKNNLGLWSKCK